MSELTKVWDGTSKSRPDASTHASGSPEDHNRMVKEIQDAQTTVLDAVAEAEQHHLRARALERRAQATVARKATCEVTFSVDLPAVVPNGTATKGIWIPCSRSMFWKIAVAYKTKPSSAAGTILMNIKRVRKTVDSAIVTGIDLETLTDGAPTRIMKPTDSEALKTIQPDDYLYVELVSDNADAVDGVGGVLTLTREGY